MQMSTCPGKGGEKPSRFFLTVTKQEGQAGGDQVRDRGS